MLQLMVIQWDLVGWRKGSYTGLNKNHKHSGYPTMVGEINGLVHWFTESLPQRHDKTCLILPFYTHRCSAELLELYSSPWPVMPGTKMFVVSIFLPSWISLLCSFLLHCIDCLYKRLKIIIDTLSLQKKKIQSVLLCFVSYRCLTEISNWCKICAEAVW